MNINYQKALNLRLQGKSYGEINHALNIPKSTLSNWLKNLTLPPTAQKILQKKDRKTRTHLTTFNKRRTKSIQIENKKIRKSAVEEIKKLLNKYTYIIEQLRKIKVIRTGKVVADYGEYIASQKLNLKLMDNSVNKGYDAVDINGKKYEIKTRKATAWNKPNIFPVKLDQLSVIDFLIYVEFNNKWDIVRLLKIPAREIKANKYNRVCVSQDLIKRFSIS